MRRQLFISVALILFATSANAGPIYRASNVCPTNADMAAVTDPEYTRQYTVVDALACVYDPLVSNIQGDQDDLDAYFGVGWSPLGQDGPGSGDIGNFSYTGTTNGLFTISSPTFTQYAVGVKDGGDPKWAIFLMPSMDFSSLWSITPQGSLSHFTLYGRNTLTGEPQCAPPFVCSDEPPNNVPDGGATVMLLGMGMLGMSIVMKKAQ